MRPTIRDRGVNRPTMRPTPQPPPLEVYMLGLVDFEEVQQLQRRLVYDLGERGGASLVLCEHPPTISVGRSGSRAHILADDDELRGLGVKVHWVNRGGGCVLHVPGPARRVLCAAAGAARARSSALRRRLHAAILGVLDEFDLQRRPAARAPGRLPRARRGSPRVGVAVNRWIAYHGLTLNVGPFLEPFGRSLDEPGIGTGRRSARRRWKSRRQRPDADAEGARVADPPDRRGSSGWSGITSIPTIP